MIFFFLLGYRIFSYNFSGIWTMFSFYFFFFFFLFLFFRLQSFPFVTLWIICICMNKMLCQLLKKKHFIEVIPFGPWLNLNC